MINNKWAERELMPKSGVAWWKCDEPSGNLIDSKGGYTGTATGLDYGVTEGIVFNGTSSYVQMANPVIPIGAKSVYFEIKVSSATGVFMIMTQTIGSEGHGFQVSITDGMMYVSVNRGVIGNPVFIISPKEALVPNVWYKVLFTWDGTTNDGGVKLYIDDMINPVSISKASFTQTVTPSYNLRIGRGQSVATLWYKGLLKNIQVYNKVIDPISKFSLIKSDSKTYTLNNNLWDEVLETLDDTVYQDIGITDLTSISESKWCELSSEVGLMTWCDKDMTSMSVDCTSKELIPPVATITVPPYRPLDELEKPVSVLYYKDGVTNDTPNPKLRQEYDLNVGVRQMIKKPMP